MDSTLFIRSVLRILSGNYPVRVLIGILIGFVLDGSRLFVIAYISNSDISHGLLAFPLTAELAIGVLLSFLAFILPGHRKVPEQILIYFDTFDEGAARMGMSRHQRKLLYQSAFSAIEKKFLSQDGTNMSILAERVLSEQTSHNSKD